MHASVYVSLSVVWKRDTAHDMVIEVPTLTGGILSDLLISLTFSSQQNMATQRSVIFLNCEVDVKKNVLKHFVNYEKLQNT